MLWYRSIHRACPVDMLSRAETKTDSLRYEISPVSESNRNVRTCTSCNPCTEFHTYHPMLAMRANARAVASMTSRIGKALATRTLSAPEGVIETHLLYSGRGEGTKKASQKSKVKSQMSKVCRSV